MYELITEILHDEVQQPKLGFFFVLRNQNEIIYHTKQQFSSTRCA